MSWFKGRALLCAAMISLLAAAGCDFKPLYGEKAEQGYESDRMLAIWVDAKKAEVDFELANRIRYELYGGTPGNELPDYRLRFEAKSETIQTTIERRTGDPRTFTLTLSADFVLTRLEDESKVKPGEKVKPIFTTRLVVRSSYDATNQRLGREAAREDAFKRSAREMAHRLQRELAIFFNSANQSTE